MVISTALFKFLSRQTSTQPYLLLQMQEGDDWGSTALRYYHLKPFNCVQTNHVYFSCQNSLDEAGWFLSLRVFGLLSSSSLLFPQGFGQYVLRPSSAVCWTREPTRNFELRLLLISRGSPVLLPLAISVKFLSSTNNWRRLEDISAETLWK